MDSASQKCDSGRGLWQCYLRASSSSMLHPGLVWICLVSWMVSSSQSVDVNCCPKGSVWQAHSLNCSDGMKIQLSCPYGSYLIDPSVDTDNFTVVHENGQAWLRFTEIHYQSIPSSRFCMVDGENSSQAIVCFEGEYSNEHSSIWREILFCVLGVISAVFLIATLAVYVLLPELREIQDKVMMAVVTALAVSYIVLSIQNLRPQEENDEAICVSLGFILYFSFMSAFFWLNIVAFNIWRTVWFKNCTIKERNLFTAYCIYGWGGPLCFLVATLLTHHLEGEHLKPGFGERNCWFSGNEQMWAYFYGPIGILLTLNMIYLGMAGWRLWHQYCDYSGNKLRVLRFKCMLYIKLIFVMGITWIFEVVSYAEGSKDSIWIPTDILNALQGLIIFLLLVATRKRVRKLLARKRPCGIAFPKSWTAYEDEECEDVLPEEIELSQQG
ncbi:putative G-protein coupled receptor Mth-like 1 isoform X1 [Lasioglossum baleicum]|uniref:putative G-protein coupled receptor Mth-like 1 isoform X1 n=1 Tax=Lasioglossum baleicum TaxID=434251 RepID=UPI003FCDC099